MEFVCNIVEKTPDVPEEKTLRQWAINAKPEEYQTLNIKGFGIAGFQYLRMLFGADTTKPDKHIRDFIFEILNRYVSDIDAVFLLETASKRVGFSVRDVDAYIWDKGARGEQNANDPNMVRLDPDVAAAFPTEEAVNEALRYVLKERNKEE